MERIARVRFRDVTHASSAWLGVSVDAPRAAMLTASVEVNGDIDLMFDGSVLAELIGAVVEAIDVSRPGDSTHQTEFMDLDEMAEAYIHISDCEEGAMVRLGIRGDREIRLCVPTQATSQWLAALQQAHTQLST